MKKLKYIILAMVIVLSGCSTATKSQNTESMEDIKPAATAEALVKTEEAKADVVTMSGDTKIMPPSTGRTKIKSSKPEMKLEDIITKMKSLLEIGDEYNEVSSSEYIDENGLKNYNINYTNTSANESAWLSTDGYGNLFSYGLSYGNQTNEKTAVFTREVSMEKAKALLVKMYGEQASEWVTIKPYNSYSLESPTYNFSFQRSFEGVPIASDRIDMEVNKYNVKVTSMYVTTGTNYDFSDNSYLAAKADVKDIEEAYAKYKLENKLYKGFLGTTDYKSTSQFRKLNYINVYSLFGNQISIDAKTLEPKYIQDTTYYAMGDMAEAKGASLSEVEQEMIDNIKSQKTVEEAEKRARDLFNLDSSYKLTWSSFGNYMSTKDIYKWDLSFSNDSKYVGVGMIGKDLELINYSKSDMNATNSSNTVKPEEAKNVAETFLTKKANMNLKELELSPVSKFPQDSGGFNLTYMRSLGDEKYVVNSTVNITVSTDGKEVVNFYKDWDYDFQDKEFTSTLTVDEAYEVLRDSYGFNLVYKRDFADTSDKPVKLYYEITSPPYLGYPGNSLMVDANTKKIIDYNGAPVQLLSDINYSDLNESKYQEQIKELAENGVGFSDGVLLPKQEIKQIEALRLLYSLLNYGASPSNLSDDEIYEGLKWTMILGSDAREPNKIVTNEDMAKYTLRSMNYQKIADRGYLFDDKFTDMSKDSANYGYLVLAKDLGFIQTGSDTILEPTKKIDRETALFNLYNYVKGK